MAVNSLTCLILIDVWISTVCMSNQAIEVLVVQDYAETALGPENRIFGALLPALVIEH